VLPNTAVSRVLGMLSSLGVQVPRPNLMEGKG
jgi:hypothetical protein